MISPEERQGADEEPRLFPLGQLVATTTALSSLPEADLLLGLGRHMHGDWGDVSPHDWQANQQALLDGSRLFSVYHTRDGVKFYVITEADRSLTTILLASDY